MKEVEAAVCRYSTKQVFLAILQKFTGYNLFFNKFAGPGQVFSCEFWKISKNTFFYRTPSVAASERESIHALNKRVQLSSSAYNRN